MTRSYDQGDPLRWLKPLLHTNFFQSCRKHSHLSRNECNLYCLDCPGQAICCPCTIDHQNHRMLQIRRSSYHNVIRVSEIHKVLDITGVQTYVINSARVVFLHHRPQIKPVKTPLRVCEICERSLPQSYRYCSLACKLAGITQLNEKFQPRETKKERNSCKQPQQQPDHPTTTPSYEEHFHDPKAADDAIIDRNHGIGSSSNNSRINDNISNASQIPDATTLQLHGLSPPTPPPIIANIDRRNPSSRRKGLPQRAPPL